MKNPHGNVRVFVGLGDGSVDVVDKFGGFYKMRLYLCGQ
jgi:hypothetical protein